MSYRWHAFYLVIIAALLAALLLQGAKAQRAALTAQQAVAAANLYQTIRQAPGRYQVLDLREALEFEDGHLPQAINIQPQTLPTAQLDRWRRTVVVTDEGDREAFVAAAREIKLAVNLEGGMTQWRMSRLPEVSGLTDTTALRRGRPG
ncbi:MAG: rhodanese-like domain-containing protein [Gammaproteobacteria bacterium]|nr:rhodanese-like domain-containing protein [Gammaproteobacteria bacterium]